MTNEKRIAELKKQIEEEEKSLFYEEMANDYLYTLGDGYKLRSHIDQLRQELKSLQ